MFPIRSTGRGRLASRVGRAIDGRIVPMLQGVVNSAILPERIAHRDNKFLVGGHPMQCRIPRASAFAAAVLAPVLMPLAANAQIAVSANDGKAILVDGASKMPENPAPDTVTIIDLGATPPKVLGELQAPSSVAGPPQNVAITPDESIALVSSNMKLDPADPKKTRARQPGVGDRPQGQSAGGDRHLGGRHLAGRHLDQPRRQPGADRQSGRRHRVDLHDRRQDRDRRRQGRFRQPEVAAPQPPRSRPTAKRRW